MGQHANASLVCHDDVCLLLPWYVNQTLPDAEREMVEEHIKVCVAGRGELPVQQNLMKNVRDSATIELCEHVQYANLIQKIRTEAKAEAAPIKRAESTPVNFMIDDDWYLENCYCVRALTNHSSSQSMQSSERG